MRGITDDGLLQLIEAEIELVELLRCQKSQDKCKLHALDEAKFDCISKGRAWVRYELGTKPSVTTAHKEGFVVGMRSMPINHYDGHTLREALEQVEILTQLPPKRTVMYLGYRSHGVQTTVTYIATQKRGLPPALRRNLRQRSAIKPMIAPYETEWLPRALCPEGHAW